MKSKILAIIFLLIIIKIFPQKIQTEIIFTDKISIRAIEIWEGKVWYAGTDSKFGYVSLKNPADQKQMRLSGENLQFRTLAHDNNFFYTINVESPAHFFRVDIKTLKYSIVQTDSSKSAFYDALHFHNGLFYTFSDPDEDLKLKLLSFNILNGKFISKQFDSEKLKPGEAAFAASNTNIASSKNYIWLVTGGSVARVFRLNLMNQNLEVFSTPFVHGSSSEGIYSVDFYKDKFGIAVGGDYTKQKQNINNIATTTDAGKTWQIQASGANGGYKTCVKIRPGSKGREIIAVGDQNIEFSKDYGKTWTKISDEKNLYTCVWENQNSVILAGKDKIIKLNFLK